MMMVIAIMMQMMVIVTISVIPRMLSSIKIPS
jgi:hypothetical protein